MVVHSTKIMLNSTKVEVGDVLGNHSFIKQKTFKEQAGAQANLDDIFEVVVEVVVKPIVKVEVQARTELG